MNRRLFALGLAYCLFAVLLFLFPPFHDGRHHFYNWHPNTPQQIGEVLAYAGPAAQAPEVLTVSAPTLVIEACIGFFVALALLLVMELWPAVVPFRRPVAIAPPRL